MKKIIARDVKKALLKLRGSAVDAEALLEAPPDPSLGDIALPCFTFAKLLKKNPQQIASELASSLAPSKDIQEIRATGPYVNFFFSAKNVALMALGKKKKARVARETVVIEYVSPNTNKPLHLGHVRNAVLGDAIARIFETMGKRVVRTCLINDRGIHICKSMVSYLRKNADAKKPETPAIANKKGDHFVGDYYVLFEKMLKKDGSLMELAQECLKKWEEGDLHTRALWKKMNWWAVSGMKSTYKRLSISFDKTYFESDIYEKGKSIIVNQLKKGIVKKDETGALFADLSSENLPNKILLRRDGTALYITQDIYLAKQKIKDFRATSSIYVIGSEQNLYLQQLFAVLEQFGYPWAKKLYHLSYGMVNLPDGKMKSREGTVVDADDILDDLEALATAEIKKRDGNLSDTETKKRAKTIALSAIKFYMADVSPKSNMTFDSKQSIALQGRTGPYVLYTYARLKSILRKAKKSARAKKSDYDWRAEKPIALQLAVFEETLTRAAAELNPSLICQYAFSLAQKVNDYYHTTPVITAPPVERSCRLILIKKTADALQAALGLLGISTLEQM